MPYPWGRGVCEELGVDPRDVDVMMGTFTKSFGAAGGYIAADAKTIVRVRQYAAGCTDAVSMPPVGPTSHEPRTVTNTKPGLGSRVQGPGSMVHGPGSRVRGSGSRVQSPWPRIQDPGSRVQGLGSRV